MKQMGCLKLTFASHPPSRWHHRRCGSRYLSTTGLSCALRAALLAVPVSPGGVPGESLVDSVVEAAALVRVAFAAHDSPNQNCWTCLGCGYYRSEIGHHFLNDAALLWLFRDLHSAYLEQR